MAVISISRETGCGGKAIAALLAERLGWHLADREIIGRILAEYGFVNFRETYESQSSFWSRFDVRTTAVVSMLDRATLALAAHGNIVILGRGSFAVLGSYVDTINVRIQAPFPYRVMSFMQEYSIPGYEEAERMVRDSDRVRRSFVESFYAVKWDQTGNFNLVIDSSKIPRDLALEWILQAVESSGSAGDRTPSTASIDVEPTMSAAVSSVLGCKEKHLV
jgi:cytidylate kinase